MNDRTVIRFERRLAEADEFQCKLVSPPRPKTPSVPSPFDVAALGGPFPAAPVQSVGNLIFQELCKNAAIKEALGEVLNARFNTVRPIYIDTETVRAESIRWEALWENTKRFLALDQRWPIARRAQPDAPPRMKVAWFAPPLRILAVISAENYPGEEEWDCLKQAAQRAIDLGFPVEIQVVTGDDKLFNAIKKNVQPGFVAPPQAVPEDPGALDLIIATFKPHIVHFFCHGEIENGARLVIRTGKKDKPLEAGIESLSSLQMVWLVVLNSCDSSVAVGDVPSMAYQLVAKLGVPFVIGTLAPIDVLDAYKFSEAFYGRLLFKFQEVVKAARPKDFITIGWTEALHAARDALDRKNEKMPAQNDQWTLPVLYERTDELLITKEAVPEPTTVAEAPSVIQVAMIADLLRTLPPDTPEAKRKALVTAILSPKNEQAATHG